MGHFMDDQEIEGHAKTRATGKIASVSNWRPITGEIRRKVLVTNNLNARDAHGQMSHVWVASLVQIDDSGKEFITFTDHWQKIWGLSHYAEIPSADGVIDDR